MRVSRLTAFASDTSTSCNRKRSAVAVVVGEAEEVPELRCTVVAAEVVPRTHR